MKKTYELVRLTEKNIEQTADLICSVYAKEQPLCIFMGNTE